jgi:hypothetical protein
MQLRPHAKRSVRRRLLLALATWFAVACAGAGAPRERAACWPRFPYREGWLGGDGAFSVPLASGRSVWLFGDTFVGEPGQSDRAGASFVHNSVGISRCGADGRFEIDYFWGRGADGSPRAFLEREGGGWWWLQGGFLHEGRLYLGLLEVEAATAHGALALPFRFGGATLARIDDPESDPASWRPSLLPLTHDARALPLAALRTHGAHLYLFAFLDRGDDRHPRILLRLPLARLDADPGAALETLGDDGVWRAGFAPERARVLMDDDATEMSVRYHDELGKWIALYNFPDTQGSFPATPASDAVWARTATALEGPWSPRVLVFRIPELAPQPDASPPDPNTGCYAAKEHPQFSLPGSLTFTYVCNLFSGPGQDPLAILARLVHGMQLYRPVAASVGVPSP